MRLQELLRPGNRDKLETALAHCGYTQIANPAREDGLWWVNGKLEPVFAKTALSREQRLTAAREMGRERA
jgi:hypothetical protein